MSRGRWPVDLPKTVWPCTGILVTPFFTSNDLSRYTISEVYTSLPDLWRLKDLLFVVFFYFDPRPHDKSWRLKFTFFRTKRKKKDVTISRLQFSKTELCYQLLSFINFTGSKKLASSPFFFFLPFKLKRVLHELGSNVLFGPYREGNTALNQLESQSERSRHFPLLF